MEDKFTWVQTYGVLAKTLRNYRHAQNELLAFLSELQAAGFPTISTTDKNEDGQSFPLAEIDPFTFFSNFNRGVKTETRTEIIRRLIYKWGLECPVPKDFSGIPVMNNQQAWFIAYKKDRGPEDVDILWTLFEEALDRRIQANTFNAVLKLKYIRYNITMGLFWIAPDEYLNLDKVNRSYLANKGIDVSKLADYATYLDYMHKTRDRMSEPFFQISHNAWLASNEPPVRTVEKPISATANRYWLFAPGKGGGYWDEFYSAGIMAVGWDYLGDLRKYPTKESIAQEIRKHDNDPDSSKKNNAKSCYSFCNEMQVGDVVYAKVGRNKVIGRGLISSEYDFDDSRSYYKHIRHVDWQKKGEWTVSQDNKFALKTITDVTRFQKFTAYLDSLLDIVTTTASLRSQPHEVPNHVKYWWLNANPKIWDLISHSLGTRQTYTSHNAKGNKRRVYQYFQQVKPDDLLLGYVASPIRRVVALCKVTRQLHDTPEGEAFEFEKIEEFSEPISLKQLQNVPGLEKCEPLINNQGSLFRLSHDEYETIRSILDEEEEAVAKQIRKSLPYTLEECAEATGLPPLRIKEWRAAIDRKGQAVFYGPPGTGKTFIAEHIARHIVGGGSGFVELIQFHPTYAYEEFMQGIRPDTDEKGNLVFELKPGRFLSFCKRAQLFQSPCVLIIDEINRANLSRVFGELMYLLEYRDKEIPLAGGTNFSIPINVRIIGTMNTADRSIALVDFALRRRFAFIELSPDYDLLSEFQARQGFNASGLVTLLREVNTKINDKNFALGISFFLTKDLASKIEQIWRMEIETYLEEYFFMLPETVTAFRWDNIQARIGA